MSGYSGYDKPDFNDQQTFVRPPPPEVREYLVDALKKYGTPKGFPHQHLSAANVWLSLQEEMRENERPHWQDGSKVAPGHWKVPFIDRVLTALFQFQQLGDAQQLHVVDYIKRGYPYRGDSLEMYREVIKNTDIMNEMIAKHGRTTSGDIPNQLPYEYTSMVGKAMREQISKMISPLNRTGE